MKGSTLALAALVVLAQAGALRSAAESGAKDLLRERFADPPRSATLVPFWSWNGRLEPEKLRWQINQMVKQGVYGAFMHARAGIDLDTTPYFSDGWWRAIRSSVEHAARVGFAAWLYDEDKWPSGSAGGRTLKRNPQRNARKGVRWQELRVTGPRPVRITFPGAHWVLAAKLTGEQSIDPDSIRDVTRWNQAQEKVDTAPTEGVRVVIVSDTATSFLAGRCRELGCSVTVTSTEKPPPLEGTTFDVLISDVGTAGTGCRNDRLLGWIRSGGGYIDFSWSEPTQGLYDLTMVVTEDSPRHKWLLPNHPLACVPNVNPDSSYTGKRWSDQWWRGGKDFSAFDQVLADPRWDPPGITLLARSEGEGRVVYCGATQACREEHAPGALLQNLLVWASRREKKVRSPRPSPQAPLWQCPPGNWILLAFTVGSYEGVNYLNRRTVRDFIDITYERYACEVGTFFGSTVPGVFFDEIHNSGVPIVWAEGFAERFRSMKGYDIRTVIPALFMDIGPKTPVVRCDYYDVYTTMYEEAWFKQISKWCEEHNLKLVGHTIENINAYQTQGDYFRTMRHLQIPCTDNEDFRYRYPRVVDPWKPKQLASICHLYGKELAAVEAMGGAGWSFTLDLARYGHNLLAAYGVNFSIPHLFHYAQDRPENVDDWPNSWFFRNPYWKYFRVFADHARRLTFMLTGKEHVVDVAVLFPQVNLWSGYGGGTAVETVARLVEAPIDVDLIDPDSLLRAELAGGALCVGAMRYRCLILPGLRCLRRSSAGKILSFLKQGGALIVEERFPVDSPEGGRNDPVLAAWRKELTRRGLSPVPASEVARRVAQAIEPDCIVSSGGVCPLRYHHVRKHGKDIYWIANSTRKAGTWEVSFRCCGSVSVWQPEDGSIRPVGAFLREGNRTTVRLSLDAWQGCFVLFDPREIPPEGGVLVERSTLHETAVHGTGAGIVLRGLVGPGKDKASATLTFGEKGKRVQEVRSRSCKPVPAAHTVRGPWTFLPVGKALDATWRIDCSTARLPLPVMRIRWERGLGGKRPQWELPNVDDRRWRWVKIFDSLRAGEGALRYRSRWEGRFISFYDRGGFRTSIGGRGLACRKVIEVPRGGAKGWIACVCEGPFSLKVGSQRFRGRGPEVNRFEIASLPEGKTEISLGAENAQAILIEGFLKSAEGRVLHLFTDRTWQVRRRGRKWVEAWEYVAPPEKPYGEPRYPLRVRKPAVVWYRLGLPPGVCAIVAPEIQGSWEAWADGKPLRFEAGKAEVASPKVLALRVQLTSGDHGLMRPISVICKAAQAKLTSWTEQNLWWYSGRAIYRATFSVPEAWRAPDMKIFLSLGTVAWTCEIWVNGKLAGLRVWPPYRLEITQYVRAGTNELAVVVANLLANRMRWDIFDDVKGTQWNRKWHDGNIMRDKWCLTSGLLGPVTVAPYRELTLP